MATLQSLLSNAYQQLGDSEAVTVTVRRAGAITVGDLAYAKRVTDKDSLEEYGGANLQGDEILWRLSKQELDAAGITDIQDRDVIEAAEDGTLWSVVSTTYNRILGAWWCVCRLSVPDGG